jgi:hypothetical protein
MPISNNRSPLFSKKPAIKAFVYSVAISCLYDNKPCSKETGNITQKKRYFSPSWYLLFLQFNQGRQIDWRII